ncbi:MAG TPA: hypothetical protein VL624_21080 [Caldimonas sp.]|jgi:outer membrane protein OmpA-like peptidoglycan-associated protein|nr:hypothetical protein [Caldimonas sp.]
MPDRKSSSTSNSSRTAAKVAVAVLVVIAIAGFVLAGLKAGKSAPEQAVAADSTQQPAVAPTGAAPPAAPASSEAQELPAHIVAFAPSAANLGEKELAKVRTMAETAKKKNRAIEIVSTVEESQFGLAQQRVSLVRQTLVDSGVPLTRMSTQISKVAHGGVAASDANLVEMNLK